MVSTERVGMPSSTTRVLLQRGGRAGLHAGAARDALGGEEVGAAGADLRVEAAALDGEREGALDVGAGAHAAGADDARGRRRSRSRGWTGRPAAGGRPARATRAGRSAPRRSRPSRPWPGSRSCRGRSRRSPRGGRRGRAPSRCGAARAPCSVWVLTTMPSAHGVVQEAGTPLPSVDLDQAHPAGAERLERVGGAQLGDARRRPRSRRAAPTCRRARRPGGRRW